MSFVAQIELQKEKQQRPDEVVTVTLAPRAKKTVTWASDVVDSEACKHCSKLAKRKKSSRRSPTRRYFKSLVNHLLA